MTQIWAAILLLIYPLLVHLLRTNKMRRTWAYIGLGASPLFSNIPVGYLYGWGSWGGISKGFGITIVSVLALALIHTRSRNRSKIPFLWLFALYAVALLISVLAARMWLPTAFVWWQFATLIPVFVAVAGEGNLPAIRRSILVGFSIGLAYQALHSLYQKLGGVTQAAGTFNHQNILGLATELTLLPLVAMAFAGLKDKPAYLGIVSGLICVAGSGSRATMGIIAAAIILMVVLSLAKSATPRKLASAFVGLALLAVATPFALATLDDRFQGQNYVSEDTGRTQFEKAARAIAVDNRIGVGANNYVFVSNTEGYADRFELGWQFANRQVPVHHAYLLARAETGRFGEIVFILMLVVPLSAALLLAFRNRRSVNGEFLIGYAVALLAILIHNMYEYAVHTLFIQALLFIVLGLVASEVRSKELVGQVRR